MTLIDLVGYTAAVLTTAAYMPQAIRMWRTHSTHDLSLTTFLVLVAGIALWLAYGIAIGDVPLIGANLVTLGLAGTILYFKLRYG